MSDKKYVVSPTPHIKSSISIESIMRDVLIALIPSTIVAMYLFGLRATLVIALSVASCIFFEGIFQKITKKSITIKDCSAAVTGLLLAMNLPVSVPFWIPVVGSFVAIVVVKQLFGGLGQNFMNPALGARAFLQTAYPSIMVKWVAPVNNFFSMGEDAVTTATPLSMLKLENLAPVSTDYMNALFGNTGGSLGETCALGLIIGGVYLIIRKVISWRTPVAFIGTFVVLSTIFGRAGMFSGYPVYEVLTGGILLGAFFMATDYSSSPITARGQLIMGFGCGLLTFVIRTFGGYPEGVCYSILIMNLLVPIIDKYVKNKVYGVSKGARTNG